MSTMLPGKATRLKVHTYVYTPLSASQLSLCACRAPYDCVILHTYHANICIYLIVPNLETGDPPPLIKIGHRSFDLDPEGKMRCSVALPTPPGRDVVWVESNGGLSLVRKGENE